MELKTAGLLVIRNRKLLLVFSRNKQCYYLPGGKLDTGEDARTALCREIKEELNVAIDEKELAFYAHITAAAFGETAGVIMEQDCFLFDRPINPVPNAEIIKLDWFNLEEYLKEKNQAPGAIQILQLLTKNGLID